MLAELGEKVLSPEDRCPALQPPECSVRMRKSQAEVQGCDKAVARGFRAGLWVVGECMSSRLVRGWSWGSAFCKLSAIDRDLITTCPWASSPTVCKQRPHLVGRLSYQELRCGSNPEKSMSSIIIVIVRHICAGQRDALVGSSAEVHGPGHVYNNKVHQLIPQADVATGSQRRASSWWPWRLGALPSCLLSQQVSPSCFCMGVLSPSPGACCRCSLVGARLLYEAHHTRKFSWYEAVPEPDHRYAGSPGQPARLVPATGPARMCPGINESAWMILLADHPHVTALASWCSCWMLHSSCSTVSKPRRPCCGGRAESCRLRRLCQRLNQDCVQIWSTSCSQGLLW